METKIIHNNSNIIEKKDSQQVVKELIKKDSIKNIDNLKGFVFFNLNLYFFIFRT